MILPDHLHAVWTLPPGDCDFSGRWRRIKAYFTHRLVTAGAPIKRHRDSSFHIYVRRGLDPADWSGDVEEPPMDFGERSG